MPWDEVIRDEMLGKPPPEPNSWAWLVGMLGITIGLCTVAFIVGRYII